MPLIFSPVEEDEGDLYLKVCYDAFRDGVMGVMYPNGFSETAQQHSAARSRRSAVKYPGRFWSFKVIDTDLPADDPFGRIVGVSNWELYPDERSDEQLAIEKEWDEKDRAEFGPPPGLNTAFAGAFHGEMGALNKKHVGGKPCIVLHILATRSGHSRRGIGAIHLKWGTDRADELGLPAYVEASPQGAPLYRRWDWVDLEPMKIDLRDWGWHDSLEHWVMWREPKANRTSS